MEMAAPGTLETLIPTSPLMKVLWCTEAAPIPVPARLTPARVPIGDTPNGCVACGSTLFPGTTMFATVDPMPTSANDALTNRNPAMVTVPVVTLCTRNERLFPAASIVGTPGPSAVMVTGFETVALMTVYVPSQ